MSWGQRGYAIIVVVSLFVLALGFFNHWRARTYEAMHRRIEATGAKSIRNVTVVDDTEETYFMALLGDFSGVAITSVTAIGPESTIDNALLRDLRDYPEISSAKFSNLKLEGADFQRMYALENLTRLNLSFTNLTDANLAGIEKLNSLDVLELQYTPLTDAAIPQLLKVTTLSRLDITGTDITPEGAEKLRNEYRLYQGAQSTTQVIHRQAPSSRYRAAVVKLLPTGSYIVDTRGGGGAMRLHLRGEAWKKYEQDIPLLAELTDVESVTMTRMPLTPELARALSSLPKLRVLNIADFPNSSSEISQFASCPNLRIVRISGTAVDESLLASLARFESLQTLNIFNSRLVPGASRAVGQMKQVQVLQLRQIDGPAEEFSLLLDDLRQCEGLRVLDLGAVPIDNGAIEKLARLTQLVSLGIGSDDVNDDAVPALCKFTHLQQLDISSTGITGPNLESSASGATTLEIALVPAGVRVVHPRSNTSANPLNLADLAKVKAFNAASKGPAKAN
jgi:hypothetical protein